MWSLFLAQVLARQTYVYLTPQNKVELEKKISYISISGRPQISPSEVSQILGKQPEKCSQNPNSSARQTICTWNEGERIIEVYYHGGDTTPAWTFQRWKASGDW